MRCPTKSARDKSESFLLGKVGHLPVFELINGGWHPKCRTIVYPPYGFGLEGKAVVEKYFCFINQFVFVIRRCLEVREADEKNMPVEWFKGQVKIQFGAKIAAAVVFTEKVIAQVEFPRRVAPVNS